MGVYTMDQVQAFREAAQKNLKVEMLQTSVAMRIAFGANKKDWGKYLDDMTPKKKPKKVPKEQMERLKKLARRIHGE